MQWLGGMVISKGFTELVVLWRSCYCESTVVRLWRIRGQHCCFAEKEGWNVVMLKHQLCQLLPLGSRVPLHTHTQTKQHISPLATGTTCTTQCSGHLNMTTVKVLIIYDRYDRRYMSKYNICLLYWLYITKKYLHYDIWCFSSDQYRMMQIK